MGLELAEADLEGFSDYVAVLAGLEIRTDVPQDGGYPEDYDPAHGYTSRGFGVQIDAPRLEGGTLRFAVRLRVAHGPSDRPDMNAALAVARVEGAVHYAVIGLAGGAVAPVENAYRLTYSPPVVLQEQEIPPASAEQTHVEVAVDPTFPTLVPTWTAFDLRLDSEGTASPDEGSNGYYLRDWFIDARVVASGPRPAPGRARVAVAGYVSNASPFLAYYPMDLAFSGRVALLQLPAGVDAEPFVLDEPFETGSATFLR